MEARERLFCRGFDPMPRLVRFLPSPSLGVVEEFIECVVVRVRKGCDVCLFKDEVVDVLDTCPEVLIVLRLVAAFEFTRFFTFVFVGGNCLDFDLCVFVVLEVLIISVFFLEDFDTSSSGSN